MWKIGAVRGRVWVASYAALAMENTTWGLVEKAAYFAHLGFLLVHTT